MKEDVKKTGLSSNIEVRLVQREMTKNSPAMCATNTGDQLKLGLSAVINGPDIIKGKTYTTI